MKKALFMGLAATASLFAVPAAAQTTFVGTTSGCFSEAGATCTPTTGTSTNGSLTFTSGTFNQTTDATGFLALGGTSDGLGIFNLGSGFTDFNGDLFRLLINFTSPTGVNPNNSVFQALLKGTVMTNNVGGVFVDFSNDLRTFASNAGPFTFQLNDVSISSSSSTQIVSGQIQAAVPEPGTWAMMLLGFGMVGGAMRSARRRKDKVSVSFA